MKSVFISILFSLLAAGSVYPQTGCCPYIGSITIIPSNPSSSDTIMIVTTTTTPGYGSEISYYYTQQADTFNLLGCFWEGMAAQPRTFLDTTVIGLLPAGTYFVNYVAYSSQYSTLCSMNDTSYMTASFQVTSLNGFENISSNEYQVSVFPNPISNEFTIQNNSSQPVQFILYNSIGEIIIDGIFTNKTSTINLSACSNGIYFYRLSETNQVLRTGKIVKQ